MTFESALNIFYASLAIYLGMIVYIRVNGLRTFSKMTSFDFAMTIAVGSILGATATNTNGQAIYGLLAIGLLVLFQRVLAELRVFGPFENAISNDPVCLLWKGEILEDNLRKCRVTKNDLFAKMREANALRRENVHAVILETSGDISVLHGEEQPADEIICNVQGIPSN